MYGTYLEINENNILSLVTPFDIYRHYIPWFKLGSSILSPFVVESRPSFWTKVVDNNMIIFIDFARGYKGNCFKFVMHLKSCTYWEALDHINTDMGLKLGRPPSAEEDIRWHVDMIRKEKMFLEKSERKEIVVSQREFKLHDLAFWYAYGVDEHYLSVYRISAITDFWIEKWWQKAHQWAYSWFTVYPELKIYQPFASKNIKWRSNTSNDWLQGESQLPRYGKKLIIQSSMKDIMCVAKRYRFPSVAANGEHGIISDKKLKDYERRFDEIFVLYDNDEEGVKAALKFEERGYNILKLPNLSGKPKDPSDFVFQGYLKQLDNFFKKYVL
jgi:hypothetical protein